MHGNTTVHSAAVLGMLPAVTSFASTSTALGKKNVYRLTPAEVASKAQSQSSIV